MPHDESKRLRNLADALDNQADVQSLNNYSAEDIAQGFGVQFDVGSALPGHDTRVRAIRWAIIQHWDTIKATALEQAEKVATAARQWAETGEAPEGINPADEVAAAPSLAEKQ